MDTILITFTSADSSSFATLLERVRELSYDCSLSSVYEAILPWGRKETEEMDICLPLVYDTEDEDSFPWAMEENKECSWKDVDSLPSIAVKEVTTSKIKLEVECSFASLLVLKEIALKNGVDVEVYAPGRIDSLQQDHLAGIEFSFRLHNLEYQQEKDYIRIRHGQKNS